MYSIKILPFILLICSISTAQELDKSCRLNLGINLAGPADWGREFPFKDIMKYSREWITHNSEWIEGGVNAWSTDVLSEIPLDDQGYPLYLPVSVAGQESPQIVRTVWDTGGGLPGGIYVVLYEGTGELSAWGGDLTIVHQSPGRLELSVGEDNEILAIEILESEINDHVRNIRVLLPNTENNYVEQPFEENWLLKLAPFNAIRFMDWGLTNGSTLHQWSDRTQMDDYTWTGKSGVPYETWADICNMQGAEAWICVPHAANDDYIYEMARLFKEHLDPDLKVYVEYSNELWNWIFPQAHYGHDSLDQSLAWPERLAPKVGNVMDIWTEVFAEERDRIVRVLGVQHGYFDIGNRVFGQLVASNQDDLIDAISPTSYMSLDNEFIETHWDRTTTGEEVVRHASEYNFDNERWPMESWRSNAELASANGKKLVFYEGGHHFTPHVWGQESDYCDALLDCQTIPEMGDLYNQLFDTLRGLMDEEMLMMHFSFITRPSCQYGTFGLFQNQFDVSNPSKSSPKYESIIKSIDTYESCKSSTGVTESLSHTLRIYPNPASQYVKLSKQRAGEEILKVEIIHSITGEILSVPTIHILDENTLSVDVKTMNQGFYLLNVIFNDGSNQTRSFIRI